MSEHHRTSNRMSASRGSNEGWEVCQYAAGRPGNFRPPFAPEASVWASVLIFTGTSYVNEGLIVAASDS